VTRNQQIRKILELLQPPPGRRAECEYDIQLAFDRVERGADAARTFRITTSKKGRAALKRYCAALRRLRIALDSLDPAIRPWLSIAMAVSGKSIDLVREIRIAEALLDQPSPPSRRDASRNKLGVAASYDLLKWWGHKAPVTRGGKWAQLAKILAGGPDVDLFDHLREFKHGPGPSVEKLRGDHFTIYRPRRRHPGIE
jgi:hypothetical protein